MEASNIRRKLKKGKKGLETLHRSMQKSRNANRTFMMSLNNFGKPVPKIKSYAIRVIVFLPGVKRIYRNLDRFY